MSPGICYIFGAGERTCCFSSFAKEDLIIAADGGLDYIREYGLHADYVIGDFDSVTSSVPKDCLRYPSKKDDTDLMLAVQLGLKKGYRHFAIYGGLGGRLDHTLANIQILLYLSHQSATGILYGDSYTIQIVTDSSLCFPANSPSNKKGVLCSIFSLTDTSTGVSLDGFEYPLTDATLTNDVPLGISNVFLGKEAWIHVKKGALCVLAYNK